MTTKYPQENEHHSPPIPPSPKRVLQTIYGSRFVRNSKQLVPISGAANEKNGKLGISSDYYTFQRSLANSKNRAINPEKATDKFRKTFSIAKPSATQLNPSHNSRTKLLYNPNSIPNHNNPHNHNHKSINPRTSLTTQQLHRSAMKAVMNNTTTSAFKCVIKTPENTPSNNKTPSNSNTHITHLMMNSTGQSFRPPTNGYMRQCNNEAQDHNNYLSKYEIIKELGKGTYGVVHLARKKVDKSIIFTNRSGMGTGNGNGTGMEDSFLFAYGSSKRRDREEETLLEAEEECQGEKQKQKQRYHDGEEKVQQQLQRSIDHKQVKNQQPQNNQQSQLQPNKFPPLRAPSPDLSLKFPTTTPHSNPNPQDPPQNINIQSQPYDQTQQLFAIKIYQKFKMNKDPTKFKNIRKQINIMSNIKHEHIIKLYETVETLTKISLVVEYGGKQSLLDFLKENYPLSEPIMKKIGIQLLSALEYLHEKNIVHRDIKLQNILMLNGNVKIIDFGFSTLTYKNRKLNAICGTPNYMAPQVLAKKQYIGQLADMWSYGVVMFTLAEGRHPFKAQTYNQLDRLVNKGNYQFRKITNPIHQAFIRRVLKTKPQDRPRASQLIGHPWLGRGKEEGEEGGEGGK